MGVGGLVLNHDTPDGCGPDVLVVREARHQWVNMKLPASTPPPFVFFFKVKQGSQEFNVGAFFFRLVWMQGGLADLGEDFGAAAVREVREETGVHAEFEALLTVRQQHGLQFGRSDLYAIVLLRARSTEIKRDEYELEDARQVHF